MASEMLYLIVNILNSKKMLYAPQQDTALQFCNHVCLGKPKIHPEDPLKSCQK